MEDDEAESSGYEEEEAKPTRRSSRPRKRARCEPRVFLIGMPQLSHPPDWGIYLHLERPVDTQWTVMTETAVS
jgi:hypothetical protein